MDKSIRVTASLDEPAFAKVSAKLKMLIDEMKKLSEASKGLNFGGGGGMTSFGTKHAQPGTGAPKQANQAIGIGGVDNLTKTADGFKKASVAAQDSFKSMAQSFSSFVGVSTKESDRFLAVISKMRAGLSGLSTAMGGLGRGGGGPSGFTNREMASIQGPMGRMFGRFGGRDDFAMSGEERTSIASPFSRGLGAIGGAAMTGAGAILGGAAAGAALTYGVAQKYRENDLTNLAWRQQQPYIGSSRRAALGSIYGGSALAIRGGDFAEAVSQRRAAGSQEMRHVNGDWLINETQMTGMQNPGAGSGWSGYQKALMAGKGTRWLSDKLFTRNGDQMSLDIERQRAMEAIPQRLAEKAQEQSQNQRLTDPIYMNRINDIAANATASRAMSRALGISGGVRNRIEAKDVWEQGAGYGGRTVTRLSNKPIDSLGELQARATRSGFDLGDFSSIRQQIAAKAGRGSMYSNNESLLSAQAGGLGNAVDVYGMGAQLAGRGGAGGYFNKIQGMFGGAGGLDVTAASGILGSAQGMIQGGNFLGGGKDAGQGFIQTLMNASMGGGGAGDMYQSRIVQAGLANTANRDAGGIDPLQGVINRAAALKAAGPDANSTTLSALQGLSTASRLDIMGGGKLAGVYRSAGLTEDMVRKDQQARNASNLARFVENGGGGGDTGIAKEVAKYRAAGGIGYIKGYSAKDQKAAKERLGLGLQLSGAAESLEAGIGTFDVEAASLGIGKKSHGPGAKRSDTGDSIYGSANVAKAKMELDEAEARAKDEHSIKNNNAVVAAQSRLKEAQANQAKNSGDGSPEGAIKSVSDALQQFVHALSSKFGGSGTGSAKAPQPGR